MSSIFNFQSCLAFVLLIFILNSISTKETRVYTNAYDIGQSDLSQELKFGPIDAVYTWVNGSDPLWKSDRDFWYQRWVQDHDAPTPDVQNSQNNGSDNADDAFADNHFRDNDELRYSIRSLDKYAPWIRHIYIVTNGQVPSWLDVGNPRVTIAKHTEIFENSSHLPVFSSSAIESNLDRISGLSETFLYFNDDVFLAAPIWPDDFFTPSGVQTIYLSHPVPLGYDAYPEYRAQSDSTPPDKPQVSCELELDDYGFVDDGDGGVKIERLVGKVHASSACDVEGAEIPQSLLAEVLGSDVPLEHDHINLALHSIDHHTSEDVGASNSTESMPRLDTKTRIKLAALLDAFSQCPHADDLVANAIRSVIKAFKGRFPFTKHLRRVPSHMPHMMNKHIFTELKGIFPQQFQLNSEHRFRHPRDLQVGFAYFNYLINRHEILSSKLCGLWDEDVETSRNCRIEEDDIRIIENLLCGTSPPAGFHDLVQTCIHNSFGFKSNLPLPTKTGNATGISIKDVGHCIDIPGLRLRLQKKGYRLKMGTDVTFHMLRDDYQTTMDQLKSTRDRPTKFICLNDDMKTPSTEVRHALRHLLEDLWPLPSTLELPTTPVDYQGDHKTILHKDNMSPHVSFLLFLLVGSILLVPLFFRISGSRARRKNN
ncbi:hypothetical protein N7509_005140 [Penicillium cosmopolitanum]|uniref:Uncharacterized protein n=1 Tax=Penicillium cosmopolitanum TaxID=1131564 RepID=A0A9W9W1Y9_9EURO|nr:uncharacterized protein N7509_005140 [Penicillium cosmopolitanum]KAJ5397027.1 hypothetical protein N7509_005140 [Penicillium cosmopolitanum]